MSHFMSALHFEQCIGMTFASFELGDEHPRAAANPANSSHAIAPFIIRISFQRFG
jgi:hypothetical protein